MGNDKRTNLTSPSEWLQQWCELIEKGPKDRTDGMYVKDMDQDDPLIQQLRKEFSKAGYNPDQIILFPSNTTVVQDEDPTQMYFNFDYIVGDGDTIPSSSHVLD